MDDFDWSRRDGHRSGTYRTGRKRQRPADEFDVSQRKKRQKTRNGGSESNGRGVGSSRYHPEEYPGGNVSDDGFYSSFSNDHYKDPVDADPDRHSARCRDRDSRENADPGSERRGRRREHSRFDTHHLDGGSFDATSTGQGRRHETEERPERVSRRSEYRDRERPPHRRSDTVAHENCHDDGECHDGKAYRNVASYHGDDDGVEYHLIERLTAVADMEPDEAFDVLLSDSDLVAAFDRCGSNDAQLIEALVTVLRTACRSVKFEQDRSSTLILLEILGWTDFISGPLTCHVSSEDARTEPFLTSVWSVAMRLLDALGRLLDKDVEGLMAELTEWMEAFDRAREAPWVEVERDDNVQRGSEELNNPTPPWQVNGCAEIVAEEPSDDCRNITTVMEVFDRARQAAGAEEEQEHARCDAEVCSNHASQGHENEWQEVTTEELQPDHRTIPVFPTGDEITGWNQPRRDSSSARETTYRDTDDYLSTQYRFLRAALVCFMREIRRQFQQNPENGSADAVANLSMDVWIQSLYPAVDGIRHRLRFAADVTPASGMSLGETLKPGSIVALSSDGFSKVILFGTVVADSSPDQLRRGFVDMRFDAESPTPDLDPFTVYRMVVCPDYFVSFAQILAALRRIRPGETLFEKYVLDEEQPVRRPAYIGQGNVIYDLNCIMPDDGVITVSIDDPSSWPRPQAVGLDPSQFSAFRSALTKEFVAIQGPPGTGKSFVALKIVQVLLSNRHLWQGDGGKRILVISRTDRALDECLKGISAACKTTLGQIVKLGSTTRTSTEDDDELAACNIATIKNPDDIRSKYTGTIKYAMHQKTEQIVDVVAEIACASRWMVHESALRSYMTERQEFSLIGQPVVGQPVGGGSVLPLWLLFDKAHWAEVDREFVRIADIVAAVDREGAAKLLRMPASAQQLYDIDVATLKKRMELGICVTHMDDCYQRLKLDRNIPAMSADEYACIADVWLPPIVDRWRLYRYWVSRFRDEKLDMLRALRADYNDLVAQLAQADVEEIVRTLGDSQVIGMTTETSSKYSQLLQQIRPRIVVIDEAAEVLEAQVLTMLPPGCEHLIMIGDRRQLRPDPDCLVGLAEERHLDMSLFERMTRNDLVCDRLKMQHRTRQDITEVLGPRLNGYRVVASLSEFENVAGVRGNVFFVTHSTPDDEASGGTSSRTNSHEAAFLAALCRYLVRQGYSPSRLTVLTASSEQASAVRRRTASEAAVPSSDGPVVSTVDDYQGNESDIVLISLVGIDEEGQNGRLDAGSRMRVALSRARIGLYAVGDMERLATRNGLWKTIVDDLRDAGRIGDSLTLVCQTHAGSVAVLKSGADLDEFTCGFCQIDCGAVLSCGHVCEKKCHAIDRDHRDEYRCDRPCQRTACDKGHPCRRLCHEVCGGCSVPEVRTWPCGHEITVPCASTADNFLCYKTVSKTLPCGHSAELLCWRSPVNHRCQFKVTNTLCEDEAHKHETECHRLAERARCQTEVELQCPRQHSYRVACCNRNVAQCPFQCNMLLPCQHEAQVGELNTVGSDDTHRPTSHVIDPKRCNHPCSSPCEVCELPCDWNCQHHRCLLTCNEPCTRPPCDVPCPNLLPGCGHPCRGLCGEPCPPCFCVELTTDEANDAAVKSDVRVIMLLPCRHIVPVQEMDDWVDASTPRPPCQPRGVVCPTCKTAVEFCPRYNRRIKSSIRQRNALMAASNGHRRLLDHISRAVRSFWPKNFDDMRRTLTTSTDDEDRSRPTSFRRLALGAVCVWQDCSELLVDLPFDPAATDFDPDDVKRSLSEAFEGGDRVRMAKIVAELCVGFFRLRIRRLLATVDRRQKQFGILETLQSAVSLPGDVRKMRARLEYVNGRLKLLNGMTAGVDRAANSGDILQHIGTYFRPVSSASFLDCAWLLCERGHVFPSAGGDVDVVCPSCDGPKLLGIIDVIESVLLPA